MIVAVSSAAGVGLTAMLGWLVWWRGYWSGFDTGYSSGREDQERLEDVRSGPTALDPEVPADPRPGSRPARVSDVRWAVPRVESDDSARMPDEE